MYIIVGLGNPGREYADTRHNMGFMALDILAARHNIDIRKENFRSVYGEGRIGTERVILAKPLTFMNNSGWAVRDLVNWFKIEHEQLIVIYDDISLEVGRLRIREKGSHGGHNGIKSIIANLSSDVFPRVKIGVGGPKGDLVSHVLGKFSNSEIEVLRESIMATSEAVATILSRDTKEAMNKFNGFKASAISD